MWRIPQSRERSHERAVPLAGCQREDAGVPISLPARFSTRPYLPTFLNKTRKAVESHSNRKRDPPGLAGFPDRSPCGHSPNDVPNYRTRQAMGDRPPTGPPATTPHSATRNVTASPETSPRHRKLRPATENFTSMASSPQSTLTGRRRGTEYKSIEYSDSYISHHIRPPRRHKQWCP